MYYAGPHTVTWNSITLGRSAAGVRIVTSSGVAPVYNDEEGLVDALFTGDQATLTFELFEPSYIQGLETAKPATNWGKNSYGIRPTIGQFAVQNSIAKVLVVTPVNLPGIKITADNAIAIGNIEMLLTSRRPVSVPLSFMLLPYTDTGVDMLYKIEKSVEA
jgi:hypothetical protein